MMTRLLTEIRKKIVEFLCGKTTKLEEPPNPERYSFCETIAASGNSSWHIRKLTAAGPKFGGGADTSALCGRKVAWDLEVPMTKHHVQQSACQKCREIYRSIISE